MKRASNNDLQTYYSEREPYYYSEKLGETIIIFDPVFLANLLESFTDGCVIKMGEEGLALANLYVRYKSALEAETDVLLALDTAVNAILAGTYVDPITLCPLDGDYDISNVSLSSTVSVTLTGDVTGGESTVVVITNTDHDDAIAYTPSVDFGSVVDNNDGTYDITLSAYIDSTSVAFTLDGSKLGFVDGQDTFNIAVTQVVLATPVISGANTANEHSDVILTAVNYDDTVTYQPSVTSGSVVDNDDGTFAVSLDDYDVATANIFSVYATKAGNTNSASVDHIIAVDEIFTPQLPSPTLTGNITGIENLIVTITDTAYDATVSYDPSVNFGSVIDNSDGTYDVTLPDYSAATSMTLTLNAAKVDYINSQDTFDIAVTNTVTTTPILTGNTSATESTDLTVTISNYSATATYSINVESGTFDIVSDVITWHLPVFTGVDDSHIMTVYATEPSDIISLVASHVVAVVESSLITLDQVILYENLTIDGTNFPTLVNVDLSGNTILATADSASAISDKVEQNIGDGDFTNDSFLYTIDSATAIEVVLSGQELTDGDILMIDNGAGTLFTEFNTSGKITGVNPYTVDITSLGNSSSPTKVGNKTKALIVDNIAKNYIIGDGANNLSIADYTDSNVPSATYFFGTGALLAGTLSGMYDNTTAQISGEADLNMVFVNTPSVINKMRLYTYYSSAWSLNRFKIYGSNDAITSDIEAENATWSLLSDIADTNTISLSWTDYYTFINNTSYTAYRLEIVGAGTSGWAIYEMEFIDSTEYSNTSVTVSGQTLTDGDTILLNDGASTSLVEFDTTGKVIPLTNNIVSSINPFGDGSLIAKYELNSDATDTTGTYNGTTGSTTYIPGKFSNALDLSNTETFSAPVPYASIISASAFIYLDGTNDILLFGYHVSVSTEGSKRVKIASNGDIYTLSNNGFVWVLALSSAVIINKYTHIVIVQNIVGSINIYVDGVSIGTFVTTLVTANVNNVVNNYGIHDQLEFYNRVLTESEVGELYIQRVSSTVDIATVGLTNAPTIVTKDTASISTSLVATGGADDFVARTVQSHTADAITSPTKITDVFDTDTRIGRDFKHKVELSKSGNEVTRINTPIQKLG